MTEDEMIGWHHRLNGHEFEQILGDGEGQGSLGPGLPHSPSSASSFRGLSSLENQGDFLGLRVLSLK